MIVVSAEFRLLRNTMVWLLIGAASDRHEQAVQMRLADSIASRKDLLKKLPIWIMAARPRTLTISVTPVMVGACLSWAAKGEFIGSPSWLRSWEVCSSNSAPISTMMQLTSSGAATDLIASAASGNSVRADDSCLCRARCAAALQSPHSWEFIWFRSAAGRSSFSEFCR